MEFETERHADDCDKALENTTLEINLSTAKIQERLNGVVREFCIDCEEPIPEERQAYAREKGIPVERCTLCQEVFEKDDPEYRGLRRPRV